MINKTHTLRLSRIAHELRGPTGVALGAAQELARQSGGGEPFVGMMQRGLSRVLRIADRLGRASDLQNGLVEVNLRPLRLNDLIEREVKAAAELEHKSNVTVQTVLATDLETVNADAEWVGFCVREIVANAIQHAKKSVRITISRESEIAVVSVEDDGPGFRELPAFEFDAPPNPRRGVGLSLPICHCVFTRYHPGALSVETSELGGARVMFSLATRGAD